MQRPHPAGYEFGCPEGEWTGRFDEKQWGDNKNLVLYFTDERNGGHWWFSVFWKDAYRARDGQINFKEEEAGGRYRLNTRRNKKGNPVFLGATKLEVGEDAEPEPVKRKGRAWLGKYDDLTRLIVIQ
jgi:hypothetical protein